MKFLFFISLCLLFSSCNSLKWFPRKGDCGCLGRQEQCKCCNCNTCVTDLDTRLIILEKEF